MRAAAFEVAGAKSPRASLGFPAAEAALAPAADRIAISIQRKGWIRLAAFILVPPEECKESGALYTSTLAGGQARMSIIRGCQKQHPLPC